MEEFLVAIIEYHYSHQTEFNDKGIAFNGASCFREKKQQYCKGGTLLQDNATILIVQILQKLANEISKSSKYCDH